MVIIASLLIITDYFLALNCSDHGTLYEVLL